MQLIYITGVEGSGKSTVSEYLNKIGLKAIDIDKEGLSKRYYKGTWKTTEKTAPSNLTFEWYKKREWKIKPSDLQTIKDSVINSKIFICGITENFNDVQKIVDKVICLTLPPDTVVKRIMTRENNTFGKKEPELMYILRKHNLYEELNRKTGSCMVDATKPIDKVVESILECTK